MLLGELARLRRDEQRELARLEQIEDGYEKSCAEMSEIRVSGADPWELKNADDHCRALADDVKVQQLSLDAARRAAEAKLAQLIEASRNRKILEQLRDKQRREYEIAAAKLEQKEIEDVSSARYPRGAA